MAGIGLITPGGSGTSSLTPTATKTAPYTAAVGDLAMMNVAGGATALTLPTAPADKAQVGYRAIGATTTVPLTVTAGGSDKIGTTAATTASIVLADEVVILQYDAANTRWLGVSNVKTQASLDARFTPLTGATSPAKKRTGRLADIPVPTVMLHQGCGKLGGLIGSWEAYRQGIGIGAPWIDLDLHYLRDGTWLIYHDSTTTGQTATTFDSTTISGPTDDQVAASLYKARLDGTTFWPGWPKDFRVPTLTEVLDVYGGIYPLHVELKNNHGKELAQLLVARGLEDCVLVSSQNSLQDLIDVKTVSSNIQTALIANVAPGSFSLATPTSAVAAGVSWLFAKVEGGLWATTDLDPWKAAGIKIFVYQLYRHVDYDFWVSYGASAIGAEDPYVIYNRAVSTTNPYPAQVPYPGQQRIPSWTDGGQQNTSGASNYRGVFATSPNRLQLLAAAGRNDFVLQGWACPIRGRTGTVPTTYSINFTAAMETLPADTTRWLAIDFASPTDLSNTTDYGCYNGYRAGLTAAGSVFIRRRDANVDGSTTTTASTAVSAGTTGVPIRIDVTPTQVKITRTDTGVSATLNDTTYRGGYWWFGKNEGGVAGNAFLGSFQSVSTT